MFLGCAILGSLSSVLVFIGLRKDQREFLVPWIFIMSLDIFVAVLHFFFVVIFGNLKFEPLTGTLFTIDFFILCLNVSIWREENFYVRLLTTFTFLHPSFDGITNTFRCIVSFVSCLSIRSTKSVGDWQATIISLWVSLLIWIESSHDEPSIFSSAFDRVIVSRTIQHPKSPASFYINQRPVLWTMATRISHSFMRARRTEVQVSASSFPGLIDLLG